MENETFSPHDSLLIIQSMIDKTKNELSNNTFYFLLWGWLVFAACLLQYVLMVFVGYSQHYYAWLLMVVGVLVSLIHGSQSRRTQKVKTYVGESMIVLWTGMGIAFFTLWIILMQAGWQYAFPIYILMYATATFISGGILQFRPLQVGGAICWGLAVAASYVSYQNQILFTAA